MTDTEKPMIPEPDRVIGFRDSGGRIHNTHQAALDANFNKALRGQIMDIIAHGSAPNSVTTFLRLCAWHPDLVRYALERAGRLIGPDIRET